MVCVHEPGNVEMAHNGRFVESAGLGKYLGSSPSKTQVKEAVRCVAAGPTRERVLKTMKSGRKDGYDAAASWLLAKLEGKHDATANVGV